MLTARTTWLLALAVAGCSGSGGTANTVPGPAPSPSASPTGAPAVATRSLQLVLGQDPTGEPVGNLVVGIAVNVPVTVNGLDASGNVVKGRFVDAAGNPFSVTLGVPQVDNPRPFGSVSPAAVTQSGTTVTFAYSGVEPTRVACYAVDLSGAFKGGVLVVPGFRVLGAITATAPGLPAASAELDVTNISGITRGTWVNVGFQGSAAIAQYAPWSPVPGGQIVPVHLVAGPSTRIAAPAGLAYDVRIGHPPQLFVANANATGPILAFAVPGVCPNGDVAPSRQIGTAVNPSGLAVDAAGNVTVADRSGALGTDAVQTFDPTTGAGGAPLRTLSGPATLLAGATGVLYDTNGNLFVANATTNAITVYPPGANGDVAPLRAIVGSALSSPTGLAFDAAGNLYVANAGSDSVAVFAPNANGAATPTATLTGNGLRSPCGIATQVVSGTGDQKLYVANNGNDTISQFRISGGVISALGTVATPAGSKPCFMTVFP